MELDLKTSRLPLPKDVNFDTAASLLLKSNKSILVLKKEILIKLKHRAKNVILPLIKSDFKLTRKVSIKDGEISDQDNGEIDKFLEDAQKMNLAGYGMNIIQEAFKKENIKNECRESPKVVEEAIMSWFNKYLLQLDKGIDQIVKEAMKTKHNEKCNIQKSLYNFTDITVANSLLNQIENGIKNVPTIKKDGISVVKNALKEILNNLKMFRRFKHRMPPINRWKVKDWLEIAINDTADGNDDDEYIAYYKYVRDNLDKAMKIIKWNCDMSNCDLKDDDIKTASDIPGVVFVLADKNYGLTLLPIETVVEAETKMLQELKAQKVNSSSSEITQVVETRIRKFEKSLSLTERQYVDSLDINRFIRPSEIKLPFLKLNSKIHKMSSDDLKERKASKLKFRPVQDSSSWIMKPYAVLLMTLLRDLMNNIKGKFRSIQKIDSETGAKVSQEMRQAEIFKGQTKFFISSDMSSAYSNIFKNDVFKAIFSATKLIKVNDWRRDLIFKLTELVLGNNFIESSVGVYQLGDCLPMGSSSSQDCLNIVGMVHELEMFEGVSARESVNINVDENYEVKILMIDQMTEINKFTKNEQDHLKMFKRYIDDTHGVCSGDDIKALKNIILKIMKAYPEHLVMNVTLSLMYFGHLDCVGYSRFSKKPINTLVRRNYTAPINVVPSQSNCPASNKHSIILSEMLRYRRLCSDSEFVTLNENQLFTEMIKSGYKESELRKMFEKGRDYIRNNYCENTFEKVSEGQDDYDENFCGKITFDRLSGSHKIVKTLMRGNEKIRIKPVLVPSYKIKTYLISRRQHLKRLRKFINNE